MSQQHLSARGDGWKTPDTCNSNSEELRVCWKWCGGLCSSRNVSTPPNKICVLLLYIRNPTALKAPTLTLGKYPFSSTLEKKVKPFSLSLPCKETFPLLSHKKESAEEHVTQKYLQAYTKGLGGLCPR